MNAGEQAAAAAERSGVRIRELDDMDDFQRMFRLFDDIWHPDPGNPPITVELLRAMSHAGNYVTGAFYGESLVGVSAGFLGVPVGEVLHSHVTGAVRPGVGFALKLHQRAWALSHGLTRITWTYDPLVRRNAYFNLVKLAAVPEDYLPDFYGEMADAINAGDESDRILAMWRLTDPAVHVACGGGPYRPDVPDDAVAGVRDVGGRPVVEDTVIEETGARVVLVDLPEDIERLRRVDPGAGKAWRHAVRQVLGGLMHEGARVAGFARNAYVLERAE